MGSRSSGCSRRLALRTTALILALGLPGCFSTGEPLATTSSSKSSSGATITSTGSASTTLASYQAASAVKVIFNKTGFYTNSDPGPLGCAGDAKSYFDPMSDRMIPAKPDWLKNVSVDVTNSNAKGGASPAIGCALGGLGSPDPANCAMFDDLQALDGSASRSVLIGGLGCSRSTVTCSATSGSETKELIPEISTLNVPDVSTGATWTEGTTGLPSYTDASDTVVESPGRAWAAGDYDELHDKFYVYGGIAYNTSPGSATDVSSAVVQISFNSEGFVSTSEVPTHQTPDITTGSFAGWRRSTFTVSFPQKVTGATFTYSLRRDPTMKTWCNADDTATYCPGTAPTPTVTPYGVARAINEHSDYFLLVGGMKDNGTFQSTFHIYKPHGFSNDVASAAPTSGGDWMALGNYASIGAMSSVAMSQADIATSVSTASDPFTVTASGGTTPSGSTFNGWSARAHHRTVYDPTMNRFYIFGGLTGSSTAGTPSSELWAYDPPALGRRPTAACNTDRPPDSDTAASLPLGKTCVSAGTCTAASIEGAQRVLDIGTSTPPPHVSGAGINSMYFTNRYVFPPGGCLQRLNPVLHYDTSSKEYETPDARFEHAMAFDREHKAMLVFGGCEKTGVTISTASGSARGDPTTACNSATALLKDTWLYLPPLTTEVVSKDYTASSGPYASGTTRLPNIFSTDFWLDHFPLYVDNDVTNDALTEPTADQVLGVWIPLSPTTSPTARVSATMVYDRAHRKFYLQGGFGCSDSSCTQFAQLNDLWEFTPPNVLTQCSRSEAECSSNGTWTKIRASDVNDAAQPKVRRGAIMAYAQPSFSHGDDYYTVTDTACVNQGPYISTDSFVSRQFVGAIYVDVDRTQFEAGENLLINLRYLPFDKKTRLPSWFDNFTVASLFDDTDGHGSNDDAVVRVQLMNNTLKFAEQIQAAPQPRYHEFISGSPAIADTFLYAGGPSGQVTERQILVPISLDATINLIKIERVQGSMKFYEMTISKF